MKKINLYFLIILMLNFYNIQAQSAADIIRQSMNTSGNWQDVETLRFSTKGENYNKWQTYDFFHPNASGIESYREFDFKARQYYFKTIAKYGGGYKFVFAT
ncbi:MAG TPA: hypothetical protein VF622_09515, partial [Segetibacter sp.]